MDRVWERSFLTGLGDDCYFPVRGDIRWRLCRSAASSLWVRNQSTDGQVMPQPRPLGPQDGSGTRRASKEERRETLKENDSFPQSRHMTTQRQSTKGKWKYDAWPWLSPWSWVDWRARTEGWSRGSPSGDQHRCQRTRPSSCSHHPWWIQSDRPPLWSSIWLSLPPHLRLKTRELSLANSNWKYS